MRSIFIQRSRIAYEERLYLEITGSILRDRSFASHSSCLTRRFSNWQRHHACSSTTGTRSSRLNVTPEDDPEPFSFCGPAKDRLKPKFNPFRDVLLGDFVLCRPSHKHHLSVWLGQVLTCIDLMMVQTMGP
jgi:hypothetical protein